MKNHQARAAAATSAATVTMLKISHFLAARLMLIKLPGSIDVYRLTAGDWGNNESGAAEFNLEWLEIISARRHSFTGHKSGAQEK
ncbi:hypothetical protein PS3A_00370 [Pseudomonas sp. 3A(2025)]